MQLPPRQLRGLVEFGHFGFWGALQEQSDGQADEEAGSVYRCLEPLRRQQQHAEGTPEAGGGPPPYLRAHQAKRHEVIYLYFEFCVCIVFVLLSSLVLVCVAAVMHEIFLYFSTSFLFFRSLIIKF